MVMVVRSKQLDASSAAPRSLSAEGLGLSTSA